MRTTNAYLLVSSVALVLVNLCAGANISAKQSHSEVDLNLDSNGRCVAAKNWKDDCNDCFCVENGVPACTLRGCIHGPLPTVSEPVNVTTEKVKQPESESTSDGKCLPGSKWSEACNSCWCTDDGLSICTKIGCVNLAPKTTY